MKKPNALSTLRELVRYHGILNSKVARPAFMFSSNAFLPTYIQIETTTRCDLRCKTCMRSSEVNADMPLDLFKSIIDQLNHSRRNRITDFIKHEASPRTIDLTGLGEPLLNTNLIPMVEYAKNSGFQVGFSDNLTLINRKIVVDLVKAKLDYLLISFDGASRQVFEKLRCGADYQKVVENVKLAVKTRGAMNCDRPRLKLVSTISEDNIGEVRELIRVAKDLETDGITFFPQILPGKGYYADDLFISPSLKDMSMEGIEVDMFNLRRMPKPCVASNGCYITFDGKVLPCSRLIQMVPRDQYPRFQFGDLKSSSLAEVWFSKRYKQFRTRLALGNRGSFCTYCPSSWAPRKSKE